MDLCTTYKWIDRRIRRIDCPKENINRGWRGAIVTQSFRPNRADQFFSKPAPIAVVCFLAFLIFMSPYYALSSAHKAANHGEGFAAAHPNNLLFIGLRKTRVGFIRMPFVHSGSNAYGSMAKVKGISVCKADRPSVEFALSLQGFQSFKAAVPTDWAQRLFD